MCELSYYKLGLEVRVICVQHILSALQNQNSKKKIRNLPVMTNSSTHENLVINLLLIVCMPGTFGKH